METKCGEIWELVINIVADDLHFWGARRGDGAIACMTYVQVVATHFQSGRRAPGGRSALGDSDHPRFKHAAGTTCWRADPGRQAATSRLGQSPRPHFAAVNRRAVMPACRHRCATRGSFMAWLAGEAIAELALDRLQAAGVRSYRTGGEATCHRQSYVHWARRGRRRMGASLATASRGRASFLVSWGDGAP